MKSTVEIFSELGARLAEFGSDDASRSAMARAVATNKWFSASDIRYAVEALRDEMLDAEKVANWLSHYPSVALGEAKRVAIIMAGNIPLVGFFDLMCVIANGDIPYVKPSSKDAVLEAYVEQLLKDIEPSLRIERYSEGVDYDAVIATGGDSANLYFQSAFGGIPSLLRGSRHSVAVLDGSESEEQMEALRRDIYTYNGLGCRNVSLIFVPRDWQGEIPHPDTVLEMKCGNYVSDKALLTMLGVKFEDLGGALAIESLSLPDSLSRIHYYRYDSLSEVDAWLAERDAALQCVVSQCVEHPRRVDFGRAQYPTLWDYADGIDVMKFLTA